MSQPVTITFEVDASKVDAWLAEKRGKPITIPVVMQPTSAPEAVPGSAGAVAEAKAAIAEPATAAAPSGIKNVGSGIATSTFGGVATGAIGSSYVIPAWMDSPSGMSSYYRGKIPASEPAPANFDWLKHIAASGENLVGDPGRTLSMPSPSSKTTEQVAAEATTSVFDRAAAELMRAAQALEQAAAAQQRAAQIIQEQQRVAPGKSERPRDEAAQMRNRRQEMSAMEQDEVEGLKQQHDDDSAATAQRAVAQRGRYTQIPRSPRSLFSQLGFGAAGTPGLVVSSAAFAAWTELDREFQFRDERAMMQQQGATPAELLQRQASFIQQGMEGPFGIKRGLAHFFDTGFGKRLADTMEPFGTARDEIQDEKDALSQVNERIKREKLNEFNRQRRAALSQLDVERAGITEFNSGAREIQRTREAEIQRRADIVQRYSTAIQSAPELRAQYEQQRSDELNKLRITTNAQVEVIRRDNLLNAFQSRMSSFGEIGESQFRLSGQPIEAIRREFGRQQEEAFNTARNRFDLDTAEGRRARAAESNAIVQRREEAIAEAIRQQNAARIGNAGQISTIGFELSHQPLNAQLSEINAQEDAAKSLELRPEFRKQIEDVATSRRRLAIQRFAEHNMMQEFSITSETRHLSTLTGLTPESRGQTLSTRRLEAEVGDIVARTESERRSLVLDGAPDRLLRENADRGRARLLEFQRTLTESQEGVEINPFIQSTTGLRTFNQGVIQQELKQALQQVGNESRYLPTDNAGSGGGLGSSATGQSISMIQQQGLQGLQTLQQIWNFLQQLQLQIA